MEQSELQNNYQYHAPDEEKVVKHETVRRTVFVAADYLNKTLPDCREKSLALTKLEEATMWANAALARNG